jgi:hypothetical protein
VETLMNDAVLSPAAGEEEASSSTAAERVPRLGLDRFEEELLD